MRLRTIGGAPLDSLKTSDVGVATIALRWRVVLIQATWCVCPLSVPTACARGCSHLSPLYLFSPFLSHLFPSRRANPVRWHSTPNNTREHTQHNKSKKKGQPSRTPFSKQRPSRSSEMQVVRRVDTRRVRYFAPVQLFNPPPPPPFLLSFHPTSHVWLGPHFTRLPRNTQSTQTQDLHSLSSSKEFHFPPLFDLCPQEEPTRVTSGCSYRSRPPS